MQQPRFFAFLAAPTALATLFLLTGCDVKPGTVIKKSQVEQTCGPYKDVVFQPDPEDSSVLLTACACKHYENMFYCISDAERFSCKGGWEAFTVENDTAYRCKQ